MCQKGSIWVDGVEYVRKEQEPIRMGKRYTYLGRPARILCVDAADKEYPVIALVWSDDGTIEYAETFSPEGWEGGRHRKDKLIEVQ